MVCLILTGSLIFLRHFPHEVANYDRVTNLFLAKTPRGLQFSPGLIFGSEEYPTANCKSHVRFVLASTIYQTLCHDLILTVVQRSRKVLDLRVT